MSCRSTSRVRVGAAAVAAALLAWLPAGPALAGGEPPVADADAYPAVEDTQLVVDAPGVLDGDTDAESDPLTAELLSTTSNGELVLGTDGSFTYTPAADWSGEDSFTYRPLDDPAPDADPGNTVTVTITVEATDDPVTAEDDTPPSTTRNTPITVAVLANDSDPDGDATLAVTTDPANGVAAPNADRTITYTPNADWSGPDSFVYTLTNPGNLGGSDTATVTILVNDPPVAGDDAAVTQVDTAVVIPVLANDTDVEDGAALTVHPTTTDPPNGTTAVNLDGTINYAPDPGYRCADSFDYTVQDTALATDTATVTVSVQDTPTITQSRSALTIDYGKTVTITGGLSEHADSVNDTLEIWRTPEGGAPILMATGPINASGKLIVVSPKLFKDNWFEVRFAGDECFEEGASRLKTVRVRAKAVSFMYACSNPSRPPGGCYYGVSGLYKLFHITDTNDPLYQVKVTPPHTGQPLIRMVVQQKAAGVWSTIIDASGFSPNSSGIFGTGIGVGIGTYRVHGIFQGDADHASKTAAWRYFKVTQ